MAQTTRTHPDPNSISTNDESPRGESAQVDVRGEQLAHTKRILDLQIEGSRNIYTDALRLFLVDVLALTGLLTAGLVLTAVGSMPQTTSAQISVVLLGFGTIALFVSMAYSTKAYLGDIAEYADPVSTADGEDYPDKTISRNVKIIKRNAQVMESKVEAIRTSLLSLVGGLGGLFLGLGFLLIPLDSWVQVVIAINALFVVGYLLANVIGIDYLESQKDRLLR